MDQPPESLKAIMYINIQSTKQTKLVKQDSWEQNLEWNTVYSDIFAIQIEKKPKNQNTLQKAKHLKKQEEWGAILSNTEVGSLDLKINVSEFQFYSFFPMMKENMLISF